MAEPGGRTRNIRVYIFDHISSRNPFEVFAVVYLGLRSFTWLFLGIRPGQHGIDQVASGALALFWNGSMLAFGLTVLVSYFIADFISAKLLKMWCMIGMGASSIAYGFAFLFAYGSQRTFSAGWLILLGLACLARSAQVFREVMNYRRDLMRVKEMEGDDV